MNNINDFQIWANKFTAICDSHKQEFFKTIPQDLSLYEMKCKFTDKYQDRITFSYLLGTLFKEITSITIHNDQSEDCSEHYHYNSNYVSSDSEGEGYGDGDEHGYSDGIYGSGYGDGDGYGESYGHSQDNGEGYGDGEKYGVGYRDGFGYSYPRST